MCKAFDKFFEKLGQVTIGTARLPNTAQSVRRVSQKFCFRPVYSFVLPRFPHLLPLSSHSCLIYLLGVEHSVRGHAHTRSLDGSLSLSRVREGNLAAVLNCRRKCTWLDNVGSPGYIHIPIPIARILNPFNLIHAWNTVRFFLSLTTVRSLQYFFFGTLHFRRRCRFVVVHEKKKNHFLVQPESFCSYIPL